jgi:hypothetical protein
VQLEVTALGAEQAAAALQESRLDLALLRTTRGLGELKTVRLGRVRYAVFAALGAGALPLAAPTSEAGLQPSLAALGPVALRCETFPQVLQAVRSGAFSGVLPTLVRELLPPSEFSLRIPRALDAAATPLVLAWRPRTLARSPQLVALRHELERLVRHALM